jgi:hypothetical protein
VDPYYQSGQSNYPGGGAGYPGGGGGHYFDPLPPIGGGGGVQTSGNLAFDLVNLGLSFIGSLINPGGGSGGSGGGSQNPTVVVQPIPPALIYGGLGLAAFAILKS